MSQNSLPDAAPLGYRILTWIGIIEQLSRTSANRTMTEIGLPWPQFVLLNHFSHRPDEGKTVTGVARAMQQLQPATTKTLKAMVGAGLLRVEPDSKDGRIKLHFLTALGRERHGEAISRIAPMVQTLFEGWSQDEMSALFEQLDRLKIFLDENR